MENTEDSKRLSSKYGNITDDGMTGLNVASNTDRKYTERWTGRVVSNVDPLRMGRIKVRIFGIYDDVPDDALPWAMSEQRYLGASTSNLIVPEVDTVIRGYFESSDPYKPIYDGMITVENPAVAKLESFAGMRSPGDAILDEATNDMDYPNVMVLFKTDAGEGVTLNKANGRMKITHRSGLKLQIDPNGSIFVEQSMSKKIDTNEQAKMEVTLEGDFNLTSYGDINLNAQMNVNIDTVKGDINLGRNSLKQLVCAHPACFVTGAPTNGGNTNVKA